MRVKIKTGGKSFFVKDVERCVGIFDKSMGLMFRKKSNALLFDFKKPVRTSIHSFFCKPFIAVWLNGDKIIEAKVVNSWKMSIAPKMKFDKLLEVPLEKNTKIYDFLVENRKI